MTRSNPVLENWWLRVCCLALMTSVHNNNNNNNKSTPATGMCRHSLVPLTLSFPFFSFFLYACVASFGCRLERNGTFEPTFKRFGRKLLLLFLALATRALETTTTVSFYSDSYLRLKAGETPKKTFFPCINRISGTNFYVKNPDVHSWVNRDFFCFRRNLWSPSHLETVAVVSGARVASA